MGFTHGIWIGLKKRSRLSRAASRLTRVVPRLSRAVLVAGEQGQCQRPAGVGQASSGRPGV